jgi:hypothetical protein
VYKKSRASRSRLTVILRRRKSNGFGFNLIISRSVMCNETAVFADRTLETECIIEFADQRLAGVRRIDFREMLVNLELAIGYCGNLG